MKRVLAVFSRLPYPLIDGYKLREFHLLTNLCDPWDITPLVFVEPWATAHDTNHFRTLFPTTIEALNDSLLPPRTNGFLRRLQHLASPDSACSPCMNALIEKEIAGGQYDVVYVAGNTLLPYFVRHSHIPIVLDLGDDKTILTYQAFKLEKRLLAKLKLLKVWLEGRRYRNKYVPAFRHMILTSSVDAVSIRRIAPRSQVHVLPNGVDSEYFRRRSTTPPDAPPTLCFTGVMSYEPNDDAMRYFCASIYPAIKRQRPDVRLSILGKDPSPDLIQMAKRDPAITVTGYVPDIRPHLGQATVYVSPMRMGSGIKNKILEAWAMSTPIVSTSLGCTGVDAKPGTNIVIADDPRSFVREVLDLLTDPQKRERLARNGRTWVESHYSWKVRGQALSTLLLDIASNAAATPAAP